jgi:hypothetical protein
MIIKMKTIVGKQVMNRITIAIVVLISLIFLQDCNTVESGINTRIDSKIVLKFYEWYPVINDKEIGTPKIYLNLFTEKQYPCCNYGLKLQKTVNGNDISIKIYNVIEPNVCLTAFGPVSEVLPLDLPNGNYNLKVYTNRLVDNFVITISNEKIFIKGQSNKNSYSLYDTYYRFPKNSFAYMCGTLASTKYIYDDFLDTLKSKISLREFTFPTNGQKPYPDSMGGHYYERAAKYFIYESEEEYDKIGQILNTYTKNHSQDMYGVSIRITNWLNKSYFSWLNN